MTHLFGRLVAQHDEVPDKQASKAMRVLEVATLGQGERAGLKQ